MKNNESCARQCYVYFWNISSLL